MPENIPNKIKPIDAAQRTPPFKVKSDFVFNAYIVRATVTPAVIPIAITTI